MSPHFGLNLGHGQQGKTYLMADQRLSVRNSASHGHHSRAVVDGGVQEHELMSAFTATI